MGALARDTDRASEQVQISILRALPAWRKLEMLADACDTANALALVGLRSRFPDVSEAVLQRMLMGLLLGETTATRVWGTREEGS